MTATETEDWEDLTPDDVTIDPKSQRKREGWVYPYKAFPKQETASSYLVDEILFGGAAGPGKDLDIRTPVQTAKGWATQGDLTVGDMVLAPDGTWTTVVAAYPVEANPCYAITFSTGETITAGEGHLWTVLLAGRRRTVSTTQLHGLAAHGPVQLPPTVWDPSITVTEVRPTDTVPTRCVAVDHPDRLYLVGRTRIPTHNTDWMLAELVTLCLAIPDAKCLLLRNTYGELQEEIIPRLESRIPGWVGKYSNKLRAFVFYNGARLRLGYLEREQDQRHYIGAEYIAIGFDELTLLPWKSYVFLGSRVRATGEIARRLKAIGRRPCRLATSNPGGPYHIPVKTHFVDAGPPGEIVVDPATKMSRVYVPATIDDNPAMPAHYRQVLMSLDPERRKALLEGSWDILEGVRFSQWRRDRHVIRPDEFPLPMLSGERVIGIDYGFAAPFAAVWGIKLGNGLVVIYREAYATELTAVQQAQLIKDMTPEDEWQAGLSIVVDPAMFGRRDASAQKTGNPNAPPVSSPAHDYQTVLGKTPIRANNDRLSGAARLDEKLRTHGDGWPRILFYDTCIDAIRTIPSLQRSKVNPEDVSQTPKQEDHIYDATRYLLMHLEPKNPMATGTDGRRKNAAPLTAGLRSRDW